MADKAGQEVTTATVVTEVEADPLLPRTAIAMAAVVEPPVAAMAAAVALRSTTPARAVITTRAAEVRELLAGLVRLGTRVATTPMAVPVEQAFWVLVEEVVRALLIHPANSRNLPLAMVKEVLSGCPTKSCSAAEAEVEAAALIRVATETR